MHYLSPVSGVWIMPIGPPVVTDIRSNSVSYKQNLIDIDKKTYVLEKNYSADADKLMVTVALRNLYDPILPIIEHIKCYETPQSTKDLPVSTEEEVVFWLVKFSKPVKGVSVDNFLLNSEKGNLENYFLIDTYPHNVEEPEEEQFYDEWIVEANTGLNSGELSLILDKIQNIEDEFKNYLLIDKNFKSESYFIRPSGTVATIVLNDNNPSDQEFVSFKIISDKPIIGLSDTNLKLDHDATLENIYIQEITNINNYWEIKVFTGSGSGRIYLSIINDNNLNYNIDNLLVISEPYTIRQPLISLYEKAPNSLKVAKWTISFYEEIEKLYKSNLEIVSSVFSNNKAFLSIKKIDKFSWMVSVEINTAGSGTIALNLKDTIGIRSVLTGKAIPEYTIEGPEYHLEYKPSPGEPGVESLTWANRTFLPAIVTQKNMGLVGIFYIDKPEGTGDIVLTASNATSGVSYSALQIIQVNPSIATTASRDSGLSTFIDTIKQPIDEPTKKNHIIVGAALNDEDIINSPEIKTLTFIYKDILNFDEFGSGSGQKVVTKPTSIDVYFEGDDNRSLSVSSTVESNEEYCIITYRSDFDCNKKEWSLPYAVDSVCDELPGYLPEPTDWYLIEDCKAERTVVCIKEFCSITPVPAPPDFDVDGVCCEKCFWIFEKKYDCELERWICITSEKFCGDDCGVNNDWEILGCFARICVGLDIWCGNCPVPNCNDAPSGPFEKPSECCENPLPSVDPCPPECDACVPKCKFLGCSVVGFNSAIGWNSQESSVNVDLVEVQCPIPGDPDTEIEVFTGANLIGYPVYFNCGEFFFGGLLQNWTYQQNAGGKTYNVSVIDPRQILEQCVLVIDTYAGPPVRTLNYFNVYGFFEEDVYKNKNCDLFGTAESTERGMPYNKIMFALKNMNPVVCTPVGANLYIDWSTFDVPVPEYYKIAGPSITILQLLLDICDEAGYDFFVTLEPGDIIRIYPVSLKQYDPIEDNLFFGFNLAQQGICGPNVIDYTYGKELRIAKTRNLLFGEQQHYLDVVYWGDQDNPQPESEVQYVFNGVTGQKEFSLRRPGDNTDPFEFYFGEEVDPETGETTPVIPYKREYGQFWVDIDIRKLNINLIIPFPEDRMNICEYDIRTAMSSFEAFWSWVAHTETPSELGKAMQSNWPITYTPEAVLRRLNESAVTLPYAIADAAGIPNSDRASANLHSWPPILEDIKKVHEWISELGRTYYGRQFLVTLNEKICVKDHPENFGEKMYTDTPTNDGGWVEPGIPVMGLNDPDLGLFRTDDDRVGPFALFCNPENMNDILKYSGSGGGEYEYTLGSGVLDISVPPIPPPEPPPPPPPPPESEPEPPSESDTETDPPDTDLNDQEEEE